MKVSTICKYFCYESPDHWNFNLRLIGQKWTAKINFMYICAHTCVNTCLCAIQQKSSSHQFMCIACVCMQGCLFWVALVVVRTGVKQSKLISLRTLAWSLTKKRSKWAEYVHPWFFCPFTSKLDSDYQFIHPYSE